MSIEKKNKNCYVFYPYKNRLPKSGVRKIPTLKDYYSKLLKKIIENENAVNKQDSYKVEIVVFDGNGDKLGGGDLDNYAKAILDIITKSKRIWKDDKQVDELKIVRKYSGLNSKIQVTLK